MAKTRSPKSTEPAEGFGKVLAYYKDRSGLTWEEIGARVGVKPTTLAGWLRYSAPPNRPFILPRLAHVLAAPQEYLEKAIIEPEGEGGDVEESVEAELRRLLRIVAPSLNADDALDTMRSLDLLSPELRQDALRYLGYLTAQARERRERNKAAQETREARKQRIDRVDNPGSAQEEC